MCPDGTQGNLGDCSLKEAALLATLYQGSAIFNHHGPPESLLCEDQGPLLTLMSHIMMDTI